MQGHSRLLAGMVWCGCGDTMSPRTVYWGKKISHDYYECLSSRNDEICGARPVRVGAVEAEVWDRILNLARDDQVLRSAIELVIGSDEQLFSELDQKIRHQMARLAEPGGPEMDGVSLKRAVLLALGAQIIIINQYIQVELSIPVGGPGVVRLVVV